MSRATPSDLKALRSALQRVSDLRHHFESLLDSTSSPPAQDNAPNPLHVLRDASSLLKAQTTKLSLLVINPPFTPSAITSVLRSCEGECLPAIMAAYEILLSQQEFWPSRVFADVKASVANVLKRFGELLSLVVAKCERESEARKESKEKLEKDKQLVCETTGLVWKACEGLGEFAEKGIPEMMVRKVEAWRETIKDAIAELKEWEQEDEGDHDDGLGGDRDGVEVFGAANSLPKGRKDIEKRLEEALRRLRLVATLYQALVKRRIKTFPPRRNESEKEQREGAWNEDPLKTELERIEEKDSVHRVDRVMKYLENLPDTVDELASAFYDLDTYEVDRLLEQISSDARAAANEVKLSWDAKDDEFTAWVRKWGEAMKPTAAQSKPD